MGFCTASPRGSLSWIGVCSRQPLYRALMARLSEYGLRRVLGAPALFSTAYGNVGSSIYYALGLVASYALGLTPIVFLITGVIFSLTPAPYPEAHAMFPE